MTQNKKQKLIQQMLKNMNMVKGSIVTVWTRCNFENCKCKKGEPHQSLRLTYKINNKPKGVYLSPTKLKQAKIGIKQYKKAKQLFNQIIEANTEMLRNM